MRITAVLCRLLLLINPVVARAGDQIDLARVLRLGEVVAVLRDEGLSYGAGLDQDMLGGTGGAFWAEQVAKVYNAPRMEDHLQIALLNGMSTKQIDRSIGFFDSPVGRQIISLETSARRAMVDRQVEQAAFDAYASVKNTDDPRLALVTQLSDVNDLVERNVAVALNSNFYFMRGFAEGGGSDQSEAQITADIWAQEEGIRADTQEWLFGFMLLAYAPLTDIDLDAYIAFSASPAGQSLNTALFVGFDAMYQAISHRLGLLVAESSKSSDL